jgi:hypothetical protein
MRQEEQYLGHATRHTVRHREELEYPSAVHVYDFEILFSVMEFCEGIARVVS